MKLASWANVLLGLWLLMSPWVLGYRDGAAIINDVLLGIVVGAVALWSVSVPSRHTAPAWINLALGAWLVAAPWVLGVAGVVAFASVNGPVVGILMVIFAAIRIDTARVPVA